MAVISDLPDDILRSIVRWLPMREAVRLSRVCKKWRHLWASSIAHIDFDEAQMVSSFEYPSSLHGMTRDTRSAFDRERALRFAGTVDGFLLSLRDVPKLDSFRVSFPLREESTAHHIDRWINFAAEKQAEKINLDLNLNLCSCRYDMPIIYGFPFHLLNGARGHSLKHLHLRNCVLDAPPNFTGFVSLVSLVLYWVNIVGNQHLQSVISCCHLLESLSLRCCSGLKDVRISPQLRRLKHLAVEHMFGVYTHEARVTVSSSTKLVSLECNVSISLCNDSTVDLTSTEQPHQDFIVAPSPYHCRFEFLKEMQLKRLDFSNIDLTDLFQACLHLERLVLWECHNLLFINIPPHHGLKYLDIDSLDTIEIRGATDLVSLDCKSDVKLVDCDGHEGVYRFTHLRFKGCTFEGATFAALKNLTVLFLDPAPLGDSDIWCLLSHCQQLEKLGLEGGFMLRQFSIPYPSHPLKYLKLKKNKFLEKIELCSENLIHLELHLDSYVPTHIHVKQAPKLVRVTIGGEQWLNGMAITLDDLGRIIPGLETLILNVDRFWLEVMPAKLANFKHLKQLVIIFQFTKFESRDMYWMISLIESAPTLQKFELHLQKNSIHLKHNPSETMEPPEHASGHLKEVKISGFLGNTFEIEMVLYLIKYASSLELLTINTHRLTYEGDANWDEYDRVEGCMIHGSKSIRQLLMKEVSSNCRLEIL